MKLFCRREIDQKSWPKWALKAFDPCVENPWVVGAGASDLQGVVSQRLPPTGSVEVQVDTPHRIHPVHSHASEAGPAGCIYVIASRLVDYETKRSLFLEAL